MDATTYQHRRAQEWTSGVEAFDAFAAEMETLLANKPAHVLAHLHETVTLTHEEQSQTQQTKSLAFAMGSISKPCADYLYRLIGETLSFNERPLAHRLVGLECIDVTVRNLGI